MALRAHLEELLKSHVGAGSHPSGSVESAARSGSGLGPSRGDSARCNASAERGSFIGPYKLLQPMGEGGMGSVWMAEQMEPVRRMVAVKLIKPGMDSANVLARFDAERQALALMEHSNIARVFDAGTTEAKRPYFVMDLVMGIAITKYCDEQRLSIQERLELFVPVCQAIQHAHQKGIIHRDIKPSNVLVALCDGNPVPKVIDFGVAKAIGQQLTQRTLFTEFGTVIGTLEYMSPEQAGLNQLDIDTRSDIYSLGVLLYQLLAGTAPLSRETAAHRAVDELLRCIREQEPPRPSTRLSETMDRLAQISAQRKSDPAQLTRAIRGDLDWIVMKALEKDRNRRYETANALAMDILRYLHDEPVVARPPTATYRIKKFARKHRAPVAAAAGFVMLLAAATVASSGLALWMSAEKREKEHALADSRHQQQLLRDQLIKRLDDLGDHPERGYPEIITSEDRAIVMGTQAPRVDPAAKVRRYTVGIYARKQPTVLTRQFAPILSYLEANLATAASEAVRMDLVIYGTYDSGIKALLKGDVDFMRLGPASYVIAKKRNPDLELVAAQNYQGTFRGAIFTRNDSSITNLAGLKGHGPFAFGDKDSTSGNFLSKKELLEAGITASSLPGCCTNLPSHSTVLQAVRDGRFVAGAGNAATVEKEDQVFKRQGKPGLRILKRFEEPVTPWVSRRNMALEIVGQFRAQLLRVTDQKIFDAFEENVTGFQTARPEDYDQLEKDMEKATLFETH